KDWRPKKMCCARGFKRGVAKAPKPSSTSVGLHSDDATLRAQSREVNLARNLSPEYARRTPASPVLKNSVTTSAANAESRMHGSRPPAVNGETAPAASPINRP